jgi:hypothetical protein
MHMIVEVGAPLDPDVSWPEGGNWFARPLRLRRPPMVGIVVSF